MGYVMPSQPKPTTMKVFELSWCKAPTNYNTSRIAKVEAENESDARELLREAIKDQHKIGIHDFVIESCKEYKPLDIKGKVLSV